MFPHQIFTLLRFVAALAISMAAATAPSIASAQTGPAEIIQARVGQLRNGGEVIIHRRSIASMVILPEFYEKREYRPAWTDAHNMDALLGAIRGSAADGLAPEDYHLSVLSELQGAPPSVERDADLDLLATDAVIRLAYHLRFGKVDAVSIDPHWNFRRDYAAVLAASPANAIQAALDERRVVQSLGVMRPGHRLYWELREALETYRQIEATAGWEPVAPGRTLRQGDVDPRVPALRARLQVEGDLVEPGEGEEYDSVLAAAVQRFQERHGLKPDGLVGARTLRALNVPVQARIDQIRLSLERARLLLHDLPERLVVVNIPGFRVYYMDGSTSRFGANVVVGKPVAQTPIFRAQITHLVLNPSWVVPPGIMQREVIPGLRKDPDYLSKKGLKRVGGQVVQDPGPNNALGRIKLMFPNPHLVYLHDTPEKDLFEIEGRTLSSGCIRVQNVFDLAELVVDDPERWSKARLLEAADSGRTQTIMLRRPVPVLLTYWTAAVGPDRRVYFYEDVYGRDRAMRTALDAPFRFPRSAAEAAAAAGVTR